MSELGDRMNLIKAQMVTALPLRVVTRDLLDFAQRDEGDLVKGIYTLMGDGENGYQNLNGRKAMDGSQGMWLIGQFVIHDALPSAIEEAEFNMVDEIKNFMRALPASINRLEMRSFKQSMQVDLPYGWVRIELEFVR
jgi:hypothetical protein